MADRITGKLEAVIPEEEADEWFEKTRHFLRTRLGIQVDDEDRKIGFKEKTVRNNDEDEIPQDYVKVTLIFGMDDV